MRERGGGGGHRPAATGSMAAMALHAGPVWALAHGPFGCGWSDFDQVYLDNDGDNERPWFVVWSRLPAWDGGSDKKTVEI